jgi:hypothetical protein
MRLGVMNRTPEKKPQLFCREWLAIVMFGGLVVSLVVFSLLATRC